MVRHRDVVARITRPNVALLDVILPHDGPGERADEAEGVGVVGEQGGHTLSTLKVGELSDCDLGCRNPNFMCNVLLAFGVKAFGLAGACYREGHVLEMTGVLPLAEVKLSAWDIQSIAEGIHKLTRER